MEISSSLELRALRHFVTLADELNFRRAAARLHLSAPALSIQLKKLEEAIGVRLCERSTSRVRLTVPGEVLLREARAFLLRAQEIVGITREAAQGNCGRLHIGMPGLFSHSFMPEVICTYRRRFPKVDVSLLELILNREQMEALEEGRIHVGFTYGFNPPRIKGADSLVIIDTQMHAAMGVWHPLAARKKVSLADMAAYPLLAIQGFEAQTQSLLAIFHKRKLDPKITGKASTFNACLTMLVAGEGLALLPKMRFMTHNPKLVLRPIKDLVAGLRMQVHAVWKKNHVSRQVLNFVELLRRAGVKQD